MSEIRLNINGKEVIGRKGQTVLEIARANDIEIPTLCHDERTKTYGACGLCVVEVEGIPKLLRACATEAANGMVVQTKTEKVKASRKIALELLLSDHVGDCKAPCMMACPGNTDCQGYVGLIANGQYKEALKLIKEQLPLPASIGRVCPHPCEDACRRQLVEEPISIANLKFFVADIDLKDKESYMPDMKPSSGKKVGIIGGGPGGLSAAYYLAADGHDVTIYEAMPKLGGMLRYGIPQYRLPKEILDKEIQLIEQMGVKMITNIRVGKDITLDHIRENNDAVFVSIGAWKSTKLNCPGEELEGSIGGIDFLAKVVTNEPVLLGERVAVVGGGNTAMDACRTAVRLGAKEVYNIYRRTKEEMPAEEIEIKEAEEEGVTFKFLVSPIEIIGEDDKVKSIRLQKMELGEPDSSGRRRPIPIKGEEEILEVDTVIGAIGQYVDASGLEGMELTKKGTILADENSFLTNLPGVFAGGDATNKGPSIAIAAIGEAKRAAEVISSYLEGEMIPYKKPYYVERHDLTPEDFKEREKQYRSPMSHLSAAERKDNFNEVMKGFDEEAARRDAKRCLECGCHDVFECKLIHYANEYDVQPERLSGEVHKRQEEDTHPFIMRNPDKCILCGLCTRVCDEVMGITAIGLVNRGFDTIVKPALDLPLNKTGCISCGQCISVCPTGALGERLGIEKSVPVDAKVTHTVCSGCSVGCNINLNTKGDMLTKAKPIRESKVDDGLLCVKGRFGFDIAQKGARLTKPMVKKDGKLEEVSWEEAFLYTSKKAQSVAMLHGNSSLAVSVSDRYTNEEIYLASKFGKEVLKTNNVTSFNRVSHGIKDILGYDASSNTFDELLSTETILLVGSDVMQHHTIVGLKIKKAAQQGAKLLVVNPFESQADEWAYRKYNPANNVKFLKEIAKALIDKGFAPLETKAYGFEELKADLAGITPSEVAIEIAEIYGKSKKAMIVFEQNTLSSAGARMLANIAVISGHIGSPRSGIIQLKLNNNSQGLVDMGIDKDSNEVAKAIENGAVKGLLVFGEDIPQAELKKLDLLMVQDTHLTETAKMADVVIPAVSFAESEGTFTSSERRIQRINKAIIPMSGYENWKVIVELARVLGSNLGYTSAKDIFAELTTVRKNYFKANICDNSTTFWPVNGSNVLYTEGFNFEDKKARLQTVSDGELFIEKANTNNLRNQFIEFLKEKELI
ncbi:molybdopterin-dependent oxidoreductase [Proteiniborus sp. MB09-C3]|uniref:molybdopterin-dependent oxidoreductase n=1 Tax=Proteiniborus sp. MB09-C3 TaxID=3050072 RepID=UPI00255669CD|nr:molybdopterin-dependent oxidoreductase [Proteiniborus sp. MB09-C3]WIV13364.1 molybdopterin-dependent oxidoreductase [Proteiniborus sp. MB09-C3]